MNQPLSADQIAAIEQENIDARLNYLRAQIKESEQIWILTDEHGAVMLNTEDEDCVPVWPNREFAETWINEEWVECTPRCIDVSEWIAKWTPGLRQDELAIVAFPVPGEDGLVFYPDDFEHELLRS